MKFASVVRCTPTIRAMATTDTFLSRSNVISSSFPVHQAAARRGQLISAGSLLVGESIRRTATNLHTNTAVSARTHPGPSNPNPDPKFSGTKRMA